MVQASCFHWDKTAGKALAVLTRSHAQGEPAASVRAGRRRAPRRRIGFFSPLPPLQSEVSDYSERLLAELKRHYTIDLYHDSVYLPHIGFRSPEFGCYDYRLFERNARVLGYHALVYQTGNSPSYHRYLYEILMHHPGIATLHELDHSAAIIEWATTVIVHSQLCVEQLQSQFPIHLGKINAVPFGATALESHAWPRVADAYAEIIERTVAGRTGPESDASTAVPRPQVVAGPGWLQAAS